MDTIIKEYGTFMVTMIGAIFGFGLLVLCVFTFKGESKEMIANMTGVTYEDLEYVK